MVHIITLESLTGTDKMSYRSCFSDKGMVFIPYTIQISIGEILAKY